MGALFEGIYLLHRTWWPSFQDSQEAVVDNSCFYLFQVLFRQERIFMRISSPSVELFIEKLKNTVSPSFQVSQEAVVDNNCLYSRFRYFFGKNGFSSA